MPAATPRHPAEQARLGRRSVLTLMLGGSVLGGSVLGLAACASLSDPVVHGTNSLTPPPVPSPGPSFVVAGDEIAAAQARLAARPGSVPAGWTEAVGAMLASHLAVVTARDPLAGLPTPQPWFSPSPPAPTTAAFQDYTAAATALAAAHAARATAAAEAGAAMLWGSLSVATALHAVPGPLPVSGPLPRAVEVDDEAGCRNVLLATLHALAQVLEVGIGITDGDARAAHEARLAQVQTLVSDQQVAIRALGADPVGPLPGYDLPGPTGTAAQVAATRALVEQHVFAAHAPVIAASPAAGRGAEIQAMQVQGTVVQASGGAISFFPGWV